MTGAALGAALVGSLVAGTLAGSPAQAAPGGEQLELVATRHSLLADRFWYDQSYRGLPVLGGFYGKHIDRRTGQVTVDDGRQAVRGLSGIRAAVGLAHAEAKAQHSAPGAKEKAELAILPGANAKLVWSVITDTAQGSTRTLVDAVSGSVVRVERLVKDAEGTGKVFSPSPNVTLQDDTLTDQDDADYAGLAGAYKTELLTDLDGSGYLRGAYAYAADKKALAFSTAGQFVYDRSDDRFEQVMVYHHVTSTQRYIQSLGFTGVNNEPQDFTTTGLKADNSFYSPSQDSMTFGTGGVDDAEDAEIIWHEYGHAIQDAQVPNFGSSAEAGAIGEGFSDYWAYTNSIPVSTDSAKFPLACVGDWDAVSYDSVKPTCLRTVDGTKHYPEDVEGEVHADGEIWSRALFDLHGALGRTKADRIILEAQFSYAPNTSFAAAAQKTVDAAQALYGTREANAVRTAFHDRGIL